MPPIPIHRNDPINGSTADGVTPHTAQGDSPVPQPSRTTPAYTPATTTADTSIPPPPQPGARPLAPTASSPDSNITNHGPPAPQPSYTATYLTTETRLSGPPPQYHLPPPSDAQLAGRSTIPSTTASGPGPTRLDTQPAHAAASPYQQEHWSGAVQGPGSGLEGPPGYQQAPDNSPYASGGGALGTGGVSGRGGDQHGADGVGGAAWNMLAKAGEALRKGEEAVWKAVRDK